MYMGKVLTSQDKLDDVSKLAQALEVGEMLRGVDIMENLCHDISQGG